MENDLTLQKTLEMARCFEKAIQEAKILTEAKTQVDRVHKVTKAYSHPPKTKLTSTRNQRAKTKCYRRGSPAHLANDRACPATQQECRACGKIGHFSTRCRLKQATGGQHQLKKAGVYQVNEGTDSPTGSDEDIQVLANCVKECRLWGRKI